MIWLDIAMYVVLVWLLVCAVLTVSFVGHAALVARRDRVRGRPTS